MGVRSAPATRGSLATRQVSLPGPVRKSPSDSERSTAVSEECLQEGVKTLSEACGVQVEPSLQEWPGDMFQPDGLPYCETPTASMVAAAIAEMAFKAPGPSPPPERPAAPVSPEPPSAPAAQPPPAAPAAKPLSGEQAKTLPTETVMLQIPLQVSGAHPLAAGAIGDMQVSVVETHLETGGMVINLRVNVGSGGNVMFVSNPVLPVEVPVQEPLVPPKRSMAPVGRRSAPKAAAAPTEKSAMVCCHWKNKGWCKYGDSCKFLHPEHKRGAGLLDVAASSRSAPMQRLTTARLQGQRGMQLAGVASCPVAGNPRGHGSQAFAPPLPSYGGRMMPFA